jgi:hypothetical protein
MKRATCSRCRHTPGIVRIPGTPRWEKCHCGKLPNSTNQAKLDRQYRLEERLRELKEGKPW